MPDNFTSDYFYGGESELFSYYRIPKRLIVDECFRNISTDAKLLYGLMLDRMTLSAKNGWHDTQGRVFIFYSLDEIEAAMNCAHGKAVKLLAELDVSKGIGLIERVKQGQGRPTIIYVKQFVTRKRPDFSKSEVQTSENRKSRVPKKRSADFRKSESIYLNNSNTDKSYLEQSTNPSDVQTIDRGSCKERILQ